MITAIYLRILFLFLILVLISAWIYLQAWPEMFSITAILLLFSLGLWCGLRLLFGPFLKSLQCLQTGLDFFSESEFSISMPTGNQGALIPLNRSFNKAALFLRQQRAQHLERELVLQAIFTHVKTALLLAGPDERIIFWNPSAEHLLQMEGSLKNVLLKTALEKQPAIAALLITTNTNTSCLCHLQSLNGEQQSWQVERQCFQLQGVPYQLWHFEPITEAINRAELSAWKTLIRVLSHELNNSLAPVASLAQTGQMLLKNPVQRHENSEILQKIFITTEQRCSQLNAFLLRYGEFARSPLPNKIAFNWQTLISPLQGLYPFRFNCHTLRPAFADEGQIGQVLINLLKNAKESGTLEAAIELHITALPDWDLIQIEDAGCGIAPTALSQTQVPFYSTKPQGSGLGLALCREILSAHGGYLTLQNRSEGGVRVSVYLPAFNI